MAKVDIIVPFILSWEGGFSCHPNDKGGATNKGVTIATWRSVGYDKDGDGDIDVDDLKRITDSDAVSRVLKPHYWDRWKADQIKSQSVANILADWVWASGVNGIKPVQRLLGVTVDGIVGAKTLAALNARDPRQLFDEIKKEREAYIERIVKNNPTQAVFRRGWLNRLNSIGFGSLKTSSNNLIQFKEV